MVNYSSDLLDATFSALADPTRRAILARLARGAVSVTELAEPFDISLPAISRHLRVLEHAGLVVREKDGRVHRCHLAADTLKDAAEWIARYRRFWERQFDALSSYLSESRRQEGSRWSVRRRALTRHSASHAPFRRRGRRSFARGRIRKR